MSESAENGTLSASSEPPGRRRIKRHPLPRLYVGAAKALGAALDGKAQQGSYVFKQEKARNISRLKRLVCQAFDHYDGLLEALRKAGFDQPTCDPRLTAIIAADVAFSSEKYQPKSDNFKVKAILRHRKALQKLEFKPKALGKCVATNEVRVRYAFVNRLKTSMDQVQEELTLNGYMKANPSEQTDENYKATLQGLEIFEYLEDIHFPEEVLIFHSKCDLHLKDVVGKKHLFLYNKCILVPVKALGATAKDRVLDACAAPGNKGTLIAADCPQMVCCEKDPDRFAILKQNFQKSGVFAKHPNVDCMNVDFLELDRDNPRVARSSKILVDPSCSGGGTLAHELTGDRLQKLARFQAMCVKQAMRFPRADTVVYSTCSQQSGENEMVVKEVLEYVEKGLKGAASWSLVKALPELPFRGDEKKFPGIGDKCIFLNSERTQTSVLFVAKFVRTLNKTRTASASSAKYKKRKQLKYKKNRLLKKQMANRRSEKGNGS